MSPTRSSGRWARPDGTHGYASFRKVPRPSPTSGDRRDPTGRRSAPPISGVAIASVRRRRPTGGGWLGRPRVSRTWRLLRPIDTRAPRGAAPSAPGRTAAMAVADDLDRATDSKWDWVAEHTRTYLTSGGTEGHESNGMHTLVLATTG